MYAQVSKCSLHTQKYLPVPLHLRGESACIKVSEHDQFFVLFSVVLELSTPESICEGTEEDFCVSVSTEIETEFQAEVTVTDNQQGKQWKLC